MIFHHWKSHFDKSGQNEIQIFKHSEEYVELSMIITILWVQIGRNSKSHSGLHSQLVEMEHSHSQSLILSSQGYISLLSSMISTRTCPWSSPLIWTLLLWALIVIRWRSLIITRRWLVKLVCSPIIWGSWPRAGRPASRCWPRGIVVLYWHSN